MLSTYEIKVSKNDKQGFSLIAFLRRSMETVRQWLIWKQQVKSQ